MLFITEMICEDESGQQVTCESVESVSVNINRVKSTNILSERITKTLKWYLTEL